MTESSLVSLSLLLSCNRTVESLLQSGAEPNLVLEGGVAAVHLAAGKESEKGLRCLKVLLQNGADPNLRSGIRAGQIRSGQIRADRKASDLNVWWSTFSFPFLSFFTSFLSVFLSVFSFLFLYLSSFLRFISESFSIHLLGSRWM